MTDYIVQGESLTAVADKIREKTGDSAPLEFPADFITEIDNLGGSLPTTPTDSILFFSYDTFTLGVYNKTKNWDGSLYYSTDRSTWTEWDGTTDITAGAIGIWYSIYLKGENISYLNTSSAGTNGRFVIKGKSVKCVGNMLNILSVMDENNKLTGYAFTHMFENCSAFFDIVLPYEKIGVSSYSNMFRGCYNLINAPALPANTLSSYSYSNMFQNCISLITAPTLPAITASDHCYMYMFSGCSSLTSAPQLPATTVESYCYDHMFENCSALETAPNLPAVSLIGTYVYSAMFLGCTSLINPPSISATSLNGYCFSEMFRECTSLTLAPALPATTLASNCYKAMFYGCTKLETIPELPALSLVSACYYDMFRLCSKIKLSTTQTGDYQTEYRIPLSGTGTTATQALNNMFAATGGTFASTPTINTPYYTSNTVISAT